MEFAMHATKLVVGDVTNAVHFYRALGMEVVSRNLGGEGEVRQEQCWLSAGQSGHILILSQFVGLPPPPRPEYPGEIWLCFQVPDVEGTLRTAEAAGGQVVRRGEDRPEHNVRAAIISDSQGHFIELVGPMLAG